MQRHYIKKEYTVTTWELLQPYFTDLQNRTVNSITELELFLKDYNELGAVISENMAWRYIKMTCDTTNTQLRDNFNDFVQNIEPNIAPLSNELNKKIVESPCVNQLTKTGYNIFLRGVQNTITLFREENIALNTQLQELEQQFGEINGEVQFKRIPGGFKFIV